MSYEIRTDGDRVEVWSEKRLPFEPQGPLLELRNEIRRELGRLVPTPGAPLHGIHVAREFGRSDAENVLFYNVGASALRHLTHEGISFERRKAEPPPSPKGQRYENYVCYTAGAPDRGATEGINLASWRDVPIPAPRQDTRVHEIWLAVKRSGPLATLADEPPRMFGLELLLRGPVADVPLAAIIKPIFDGVTAALHVHDNPAAEVVRLLAQRAGISEAEAGRLLADRSQAVLGPRKVLHRFGDSIQWNPADDNCVHGSLRFEPGIAWTLSGRLFSL